MRFPESLYCMVKEMSRFLETGGAFQLWGRLLSFPGPSSAQRIAGQGGTKGQDEGSACSMSILLRLAPKVRCALFSPPARLAILQLRCGPRPVYRRAASTLPTGRIHSAYGPRPLCVWAASTLRVGRVQSIDGSRTVCLRATSTLPTGRIHSACGPRPVYRRVAYSLHTGRAIYPFC